MDTAILAALTAAVGFAFADVANAETSRHLSGKTAMMTVAILKCVVYLPLLVLWGLEFGALNADVWMWLLPLCLANALGMYGFYIALQGQHPAIVGVIAGSFPAVSAVIAILFLGQRPSWVTVALVAVVVAGIITIGLPKGWRQHLVWDKSLLYALMPLVGWGIFVGLLAIPIGKLGTPHAWFTVQFIAAATVMVFTLVVFNKKVSGMLRAANKVRHAWHWVAAAAVLAGAGELLQSLALGAGHSNTTLTTALLGSYPAFYFVLAHHVFKEKLIARQWVAVVVVLVTVIVLSITGS